MIRPAGGAVQGQLRDSFLDHDSIVSTCSDVTTAFTASSYRLDSG